MRQPRPRRVAAIKASMAEEGQRTPIEVTPHPTYEATWVVTCGWVRFQAAWELGWEEIDAVVWRGPAAERTQRQVDDNLLQDGCTALDRAVYLAAGKVAYEKAEGVSIHGGARRGVQSLKSETLKPYWQVAAERYGLSRPAVFKALALGQTIAFPTVALLTDTDWADNQSALEQIARFSPDQQVEIAGLVTAAEPKTLSEAMASVAGVAPADPLKKAWSAATGGWQRLGVRDRRRWLEEIATDLPPGVRIVFEDGR